MKHDRLLVAALCTFALVAAVGTSRQPNDRISRVEQGLSQPIRIADGPVWTIDQRMKRGPVPGVGIAVVHDFKIDWAKGYGVRDVKTGAPVDEKTRFQWASITKAMTAVVALRLVEKGALDLDRDVNLYLKSWKVPENEFTREEKVTLRRLLSHTAGVTVSGFRGYASGEPVPTILQSLDGVAPANNAPIRVDKKPGGDFRYSGGGYTIVQLLVEDVSGRPLAHVARELLFEPVGMSESTIGPPASAAECRQMSMAHKQQGVAEPGHRFLVGGSACCGLWAPPSDVARFVIAIQRAFRGDPGAILSKAMLREMLTPVSSGMGLGLSVERAGNNTFFSHSGGNPGFSSLMVGNLEKGDGFAVVANSNSNIVGEIQTSIAGAYDWPALAPVSFASAEELELKLRRLGADTPSELRPGNSLSEGNLNALGYALLEDGRLSDAISVFRAVADVFPLSANACDSLADAYAAGGDAKAAIEQYRTALDRLARFPGPNRSYERNKAATEEKLRKLQEKLKR